MAETSLGRLHVDDAGHERRGLEAAEVVEREAVQAGTLTGGALLEVLERTSAEP